MTDVISVHGARENNLKNINVEIPRNRLVVFTGVSGSGKSSLAFDTIFAEGQRRYIESLSSYARQFLGQMDKPDVDSIEGLSPAISIDQKTTSSNPRSTVGTVTEIYDYLRLLWTHIGVPHCPVCGRSIQSQTTDQIAAQLMALPEQTKIQILAPVVRSQKGQHTKILSEMRQLGYVRARIDGEIFDLDDNIQLDKNLRHDIAVIVDRLVIRPNIDRRLTDSLESAIKLTDGLVKIDFPGEERESTFSSKRSCPDCGFSLEEISPRSFSFNSPYGSCPTCTGLGTLLQVDPVLIMPDPTKSILDGGITASGWANARGDSICRMYYDALAKKYHFSLTTPVGELPEKIRQILLYGSGDEVLNLRYEHGSGQGTLQHTFEGICTSLQRRYQQTQSAAMREELENCMSECLCPDCRGKRLKKEILAITVEGLSIADFCEKSIEDELSFMDQLSLSGSRAVIAEPIVREIRQRLSFLSSVGLGYLSLSRSAGTLSGGESQRIRLASQIGSALVGVLYVLDEPSIGLHQRDNEKLIETLFRLRNLGNSVIVVEHDENTIRSADMVVDIGPGAGEKGGRLIFAGSPRELEACPDSLTGQYLSGRKEIPVPFRRNKGSGHRLTIRGAAENNLKNITVSIPLGTMTCVTGVSGSGKSSLINGVLHKVLASRLNHAKTHPGRFDSIEGLEYLDKVIAIDQSPIGRSPRSNPATYTGLFNDIRELFASTADAKLRGFHSGRFSFNVKGGRCEACSGDGLVRISMHFLPDVYVPCEACAGKRYNRETLEVQYKGKNIADVLEMTVDEACEFFATRTNMMAKLCALRDVGLGYMRLGQASTTLSGGEAQRVKLAAELSRKSTGRTFYILDEPTTGLHPADVSQLIQMLSRLRDAGNTVVVIEHDMNVIKSADYLIDLGPEGGDAGGTIVFTGTPEECALCPDSYTGQYLRDYLNREEV